MDDKQKEKFKNLMIYKMYMTDEQRLDITPFILVSIIIFIATVLFFNKL